MPRARIMSGSDFVDPTARRRAWRVAPRVVAVVAAVAAIVTGFVSPAWAHSALVSSNPAADSVVHAPVTAITLTFNEVVRAEFSAIVVTGPENKPYAEGSVTAAGPTVKQTVRPLVPGGYLVAWRVVSADGHPESGAFRFTVDGPTNGSAASPAPSTTTAGSASSVDAPVGQKQAGGGNSAKPGRGGVLWWIASGVGLACLIGVGVWVTRRRDDGPTGQVR